MLYYFYVLLIKTVKEERNSERKGRRREPKKKGDVLMAKLPFPLEKKAPSVTGRPTFIFARFGWHLFSHWFWTYFHFTDSVVLRSFVFPYRLFGQLFTGGWQTLVSILVAIYFGTIVFVRVIVFQSFSYFLLFSLYRLRMECEGQYSGRCLQLH